MIRPTLYIMAKAPIMGRAKTRLAADIGVTHAKRIYRRMMSGVITVSYTHLTLPTTPYV